MKQKKKLGRTLLSFLLTLAMVVGLMPGMSLTAKASPVETLLTTVSFTDDGSQTHSTDGVVTVTINARWYDTEYGWLFGPQSGDVTVTPVDGVEITKVRFIQNAKDPLDDDKAPFKLSYTGNPYEPSLSGATVETTDGVMRNSRMDGVTSIEVYGYATTVAVTGVSLNKNSTTLTVGSTETLTATVSPVNATDKTVIWSSDNTAVATVSDGVVTAVAEGTANITVTATNGTDVTSDDKTATCTVTVRKPESTVTKAPEAKTLTYNGSAQELVTAGEAAGGEMQYALGNATEATQPYTTSIPTATDAGTYYVWYKASGNSDYEESEPGCVEVTIREDGQPDNDEGSSGIISVENHIGDGAPDCRLEIPEDTAYSLLTEAERNSLRNGSSARFYLEVSRIEPDEEERRLTEEMLEGISPDAKVGMYFDVSMYKEVGASSPVGITDLMGKRAEFAFDVPGELRGGKDVNREFYLLHIHNGVPKLVTDSFKDQLIVEFTNLSTFVLLYVDREKTSGDPHVHVHHPCEKGHSFSYHVFQEPTTETDGYAGWVCDRCGIQDPDHADYVGSTGYIVLSAFPVFNDTLEKNIAAAPENGTVSISTKRWMSVRRGVLEALAARPDVMLSISFVYEGSEYELTMKGSDPALAEYLASGDLFFGFVYLGNRFGLGTKAAETTTP